MRRLPKRGFSNLPWQTPTSEINVAQLNRFEDGAQVDFQTLVDAGLVSRNAQRVKVLGTGDLKKKLNVKASAFSAAAREKIEKAGGACTEEDVARS